MNPWPITAVRDPRVAAAVLLVAVTVAFCGALDNEFVMLDDDIYIFDNERVRGGMSLENSVWAFSTAPSRDLGTYWHPVTWLSLMVDASLPGGPDVVAHATSLWLHAANACLVFLILWRCSESPGRSFLAAAFFAIHPIQVEAVAWAAERKTVLAMFLGLLAILVYISYTRCRSNTRYCVALVLYGLSLLAKPLMASVALVLLALDYWPLSRLGADGTASGRMRPLAPLLAEKVPFVLLAGAVVMTGLSIGGPGVDQPPLSLRVAHALASIPGYLKDLLVLPGGSPVFRPYPSAVSGWATALGAAVLLASAMVLPLLRRRHPALLTGWIWFLAGVLPALGLVQGGLWPARADRFVYFAMVGVGIMLVWSIPSTAARRFPWTATLIALMAVGIWRTKLQVEVWRDSVTLFEHATRATRANAPMLYNLGTSLALVGRLHEAESAFRRAAEVAPRDSRVRNQLGNIFALSGRATLALSAYHEAVALDPGNAEALYNLARLLDERGAVRDAAAHYVRFVLVAPPALAAERDAAARRLTELGVVQNPNRQ